MSETVDTRPLSERAAPVMPALGFEFEVVRHVTREQLKPVEGVPFFVEIEGIIKDAPQDTEEQIKRRAKKDKDGNLIAPAPVSDRKPPRLVDIINLETGQVMNMIAPAVLEGELEKTYPNDSYVGKTFRMVRLPMKKKGSTGEGYSLWSVQEIHIKRPEAVDNSKKKAKVA